MGLLNVGKENLPRGMKKTYTPWVHIVRRSSIIQVLLNKLHASQIVLVVDSLRESFPECSQ